MFCFVLCDDNQEHNRHMALRLTGILQEQQIPGSIELVTTEPAEVLQFAERDHLLAGTAVYLLDIDFHGQSQGLALAEQVRARDKQCYFIFITAYREFALPSIKLRTFDFLLKPVDSAELARTLVRLQQEVLQSGPPAAAVIVHSGSQIYRLDPREIIYVESFRNKVVIHEVNRSIESYSTLSGLADDLSSFGFFRCHKSFLINLRHIRAVNLQQNQVLLSNGDCCPFSRNCRRGILDLVESAH